MQGTNCKITKENNCLVVKVSVDPSHKGKIFVRTSDVEAFLLENKYLQEGKYNCCQHSYVHTRASSSLEGVWKFELNSKKSKKLLDNSTECVNIVDNVSKDLNTSKKVKNVKTKSTRTTKKTATISKT